MSKDLSFLEFKDDDSPEIVSMKSYWQMVMGMPEQVRKVFLQEERVKDEERWLRHMLDSIRFDEEFIAEATRRARGLVIDYQTFGDESWLEQAEVWAEIARSTKAAKYTIKDIRKQREKIQWQRSLLARMQKQQSVEPNQSSNHSMT